MPIERLGEGSHGAVYVADQATLDRRVALKVLRRRLDGSERFLREARLASRLEHPYAAHIYASGVEPDGVAWIAMELVEGITLRDWVEQHGPMALDELVPFIERVAEVVEAAHRRGIVHRDLKPANIMITDGRTPKLIDFGVAIDVPDTEAPAGTPAYMAPEQWTNGEVGPAADIYALAIVAYEALTGRRPFRAASSDEYAGLHRSAPPDLLDDSPGLSAVFARALAKQPGARWPSAVAFASALRGELRRHRREQLRVAADNWEASGRSPGMLWQGRAIEQMPPAALDATEASFLTTCRRRARWALMFRWSAGALAAAAVVSVALYRSALRSELAETRAADAETRAIDAEVEAGRQALIYGNTTEAAAHLTGAHDRGDRSPTTAFMLARALQPRRAELARLPAGTGRTWDAIWSPDGTRIVTADDRGARIWDAASDTVIAGLPIGAETYQALYTHDGRRIVTVSLDAIRIWTSDGAPLGKLARPGSGSSNRDYFLAALSPDDRLIAVINPVGSVTHVWDLATGVRVAELVGEPGNSPQLSFGADGRWLAVGGGGAARVFDVATWRETSTIGERVRRLAFSATAPTLATGSASGDVSLWSPSGQRIMQLREAGESIDALAWSPNGDRIAAAGHDGAELAWQSSGALVSEGNHLHDKISALEFDARGDRLIAAGVAGSVSIEDAESGLSIATLGGVEAVIRTARLDPSGNRVLGSSWDGTARVWTAGAPYLAWSSAPAGHDCWMPGLLEPDGPVIAIGCPGRPTRIWDTAHDRMLAELPPVTEPAPGFAVPYPAVSPGGDRAAMASGIGVEVYELPGGRLLQRIDHAAPVSAVAFGSDGAIVSGDIAGGLLVTRGRSMVAMSRVVGGVDAVAFDRAGRVFASGAAGQLLAFDRDGHQLTDLEMHDRTAVLRISGDGSRMVTMPHFDAAAAPARLWDTSNWRELAALYGGRGQIYSARFVVGERELMTAGADGTVRRWDAATGTPLGTYQAGYRFVTDATLSSDGSMIVVAGGDGKIRWLDLSTGATLWALATHRSIVAGLRVDGDTVVTHGADGDVARWLIPSGEETGAAQAVRAIVRP